MRFWQVASWCETEQLVEVARTAEELGFEGVSLADHVFYPREVSSPYPYSPDGSSPMHDELEFADPLIGFAAAATATRHLKFMTSVYLPALRHPIETAKNVATLDRLSGGRFILGIGSGWLREEYEQLGIDFYSRGRRLDECMAVMRQIWRDDDSGFSGEFFELPPLRVRPLPSRPVQIIGGGVSGAALRRAAQRCEGWYGPGSDMETLAHSIARLRELREAAGLPWRGYRVVGPLNEPSRARDIQRLAEIGVTDTVNYPFMFGLGPRSSLAQKQDYMARFAREVIEPARAG